MRQSEFTIEICESMPELARSALAEFLSLKVNNPLMSLDRADALDPVRRVAGSEEVAGAMTQLEELLLKTESLDKAYDVVATLFFQAFYNVYEYMLSDKRLPSEIARELRSLAKVLDNANKQINSVVTPKLHPSAPSHSKRKILCPVEESIVCDAVNISFFYPDDKSMHSSNAIGRLQVATDILSLQRIIVAFSRRAMRIADNMMKSKKQGKNISHSSYAVLELYSVFISKNVVMLDNKSRSIRNSAIRALVNNGLGHPPTFVELSSIRRLIYKAGRER